MQAEYKIFSLLSVHSMTQVFITAFFLKETTVWFMLNYWTNSQCISAATFMACTNVEYFNVVFMQPI